MYFQYSSARIRTRVVGNDGGGGWVAKQEGASSLLVESSVCVNTDQIRMDLSAAGILQKVRQGVIDYSPWWETG